MRCYETRPKFTSKLPPQNAPFSLSGSSPQSQRHVLVSMVSSPAHFRSPQLGSFPGDKIDFLTDWSNLVWSKLNIYMLLGLGSNDYKHDNGIHLGNILSALMN